MAISGDQSVFQRRLESHKAVFSRVPELESSVAQAAAILIEALKNDKTVLMCGNGGSASDAMHFVAELVGRFIKERQGLPAIALNSTNSTLTAVANDYSYDIVFSRQVEAFAAQSGVLVAISTSGNSRSIVAAARSAQAAGIRVIGLTGEAGGELRALCDVCLCAPSSVTATIQEVHIFLIHVLCELIDEVFAPH